MAYFSIVFHWGEHALLNGERQNMNASSPPAGLPPLLAQLRQQAESMRLKRFGHRRALLATPVAAPRTPAQDVANRESADVEGHDNMDHRPLGGSVGRQLWNDTFGSIEEQLQEEERQAREDASDDPSEDQENM